MTLVNPELFAAPTPSRQRLFLLDGVGAVLSALCLGAVLPRFERALGVPAAVLHPLAAIAGALATGSLLCYWANPRPWQPWLRAIAAANLLYGVLTACLLAFGPWCVTAWGWGYFGLELAVVALLAGGEVRAASRTPGPRDGTVRP
ncbi:hypothetical protein CDA63_19275 [Hymenobacter amundsenii]|uniref:Uncharacterized protein n=1 Tax=Hymenobacter amundsenii TaxID=2006685 RepID=A0A246FG11_9BACT|nr:hypothetical protein CDA63_19275 [Hymenobacter amundsenii]